MRGLGWVLPVALFFVNPSFGCSSTADDSEFQYGSEELRSAVEGQWALTISPKSGEPLEVTLRVEQAGAAPTAKRLLDDGLLRAAHACENRTLIRSAAACVQSTSMPLSVNFVSGDAWFATQQLTGSFDVHSLIFSQGYLGLSLGPQMVVALVDPDGAVIEATLAPASAPGTVSLRRISAASAAR